MPTITFKVSEVEAARIRELARREGVTVSEFLRGRATSAPPRVEDGGYHVTTDPTTGLPVMAAPPRSPPVSTAQIRALLADFP